MKKQFSILFALLILVSGMHITVATHLCGDYKTVRWSLSAEKATCGMEANTDNSQTITISEKSCCHDQIANFTVDSNYSPSFSHILTPTHQLLQVFYVPENDFASFNSNTQLSYATVHPPGVFLPSDVTLSDICVFRI